MELRPCAAPGRALGRVRRPSNEAARQDTRTPPRRAEHVRQSTRPGRALTTTRSEWAWWSSTHAGRGCWSAVLLLPGWPALQPRAARRWCLANPLPQPRCQPGASRHALSTPVERAAPRASGRGPRSRGRFNWHVQLDSAVDVIAIWISADGDESRCIFDMTVEHIELEGLDARSG